MRALFVLLLLPSVVSFQPSPPPVRETYRLHYVQKPIGYERDEIVRDAAGVTLTSDFDFTDRGGRVQLTASLHTTNDYTPTRFSAKGKTYRFVNVDSTVEVEGKTATVRADGRDSRVPITGPFFTIDGYAPFAAQALLLRYWKEHGRPPLMRTAPGLPTNDVAIELRGRDTIHIGSASYPLDRYSIDGVVWGKETLWLDARGSLAAAITRAGGLAFEAVREDLEPALTEFVVAGTRDRIADLEALSARVRPVRAGEYALVGGTIVDASARPPIADGVVLVRGDQIEDVGTRRAVAIPAGVPTVDVTGKTVIPGLWDMHTHVTQVEWAPVYLAAGVTTVRDMGNELEFLLALRDSIAARKAAGPRLLAAGLVDGGGPNAFGIYYATTPEEGRQVVRKYRELGFQQIKIYSLVTPAVVEAICDEAHRFRMTVTGHVPNGMSIEQAVAAGMDHIAHLAIRGEAGTPEVSKTIAFLREHGTVMDPTQSWNELLGHAAGAPIAAFQPGVTKIPPPLNRLFSNAGAAGVDEAGARARVERGLRIVRALHEAGVPIVAGTDEGIPGHSVHREIELYVEAGLTPLAALQAATIVPARAMGMDRELGTIERGKRADLAILDANPLDAIRNIRTARWTITGGRMYETSALWKSVRFQP